MVVNGTSNVVNYGTCSTAAATAAKVVSCSNFALITGAEITVKFTTTNTAANPTLNVNGTGAKAIYYRGSAISAGYLAANRTYTFRYNGTQYELVGDLNTDTDTKVTQTVTTSNASYPLLLAPSGQTATTTTTSYFDSGVTLNPSTNTIAANISGNAATATTSTKLGSSSVGSGVKPIYLDAGTATVSTSTVGGAAKPVYMNAGEITSCSSTVGGAEKPVYMSSGTITACSSTVGSGTKPIYMSSGTITASSSTVGSSNLPVYMSSGTITQCSTTLGVSITGNAATATKLATARKINSVSFDGTKDITFIGSYTTATAASSIPNGISFIELPSTATSTGDPTYGTCLTVSKGNTTRAFQLGVNNAANVYVRAMHINFTTTPVPGYSEWYQVWRKGNSVTGAVWNDYAECRKSNCEDFGYVLMENGDDTLSKTTKRLSHFAGVSSDTWGFSQGETDKAKTPIAVAGRVLVYPYQDRNNYKPGDCVCAAPGGTVDIMTREEIKEWPDRIVGTVSCVPDYEEWGGGESADRDPIKVNGRIWIKVV